MADLFPLLSGLVLFAVGIGFVIVSRPRVWNALDRKSVELNPIRRWGRRRWPKLDAAAMRLKRPFLAALGGVTSVLGVAILAANLLS